MPYFIPPLQGPQLPPLSRDEILKEQARARALDALYQEEDAYVRGLPMIGDKSSDYGYTLDDHDNVNY